MTSNSPQPEILSFLHLMTNRSSFGILGIRHQENKPHLLRRIMQEFEESAFLVMAYY